MLICETERLRLRKLTPDDAPFMLELMNEPSFIQNIADRGLRTVEDMRRYIQERPLVHYETHGFGHYVVELKETGEPMGTCGLIQREGLDAPDIGYAFLPRYWSKGYAFEAAQGVMGYARETLGLTRIVAITAPDNQPSMKLLEKLGLTYQGIISLPGIDGESTFWVVDGGTAG